MSECECLACLTARKDPRVYPFRREMIVCSECGNKRCPHATNHANACTNSNAPGQPGSEYGGRMQEIREAFMEPLPDEAIDDIYRCGTAYLRVSWHPVDGVNIERISSGKIIRQGVDEG